MNKNRNSTKRDQSLRIKGKFQNTSAQLITEIFKRNPKRVWTRLGQVGEGINEHWDKWFEVSQEEKQKENKWEWVKKANGILRILE